MNVKDIKLGRIKKLFPDREYGFIIQEDGSEVFFHAGDIAEGELSSFSIGDSVEYIAVLRPKGITAKMVMAIDKDAAIGSLMNEERW